MRRLVLVLLVCIAALAAWAPCASAVAPGISALYVAAKSGRQITFGVEGSIIHDTVARFGWTDSLYFQGAQAEVHDISVDSTLAYAAVGGEGLHILDVSKPWAPVEVGVYNASGFFSTRVCARGRYVYAATLRDVRVLDAADPTAPTLVSWMAFAGDTSNVDDVDIAGSYAYVVGDSGGVKALLVFDVQDPVNPQYVGSCDLPDTRGPVSITVSGSRAYVGGDWLCIVDVSDPSSPRYISYGYTATKATSRCAGPAVDSRYAFVASDDQMAVFNVTASIPRFVNSIQPIWPYSTGVNVALTPSGGHKRYALVAFNKAGDLNGFVNIYDASRPLRFDHDHGEWVGGGGNIDCITVSGDWAFEGRAADTRQNFVVTHLGPTAYSWKLDRRARTAVDKHADGWQSGLRALVTVKAHGKGLWYFHVRARDKSGHWGPTATIKVRVR